MEGSLQQINLSDIGDTVGAAPTESLVGSIRRNGVVQPVVLAEFPDENGEIRLRLIDGNRRVKAARLSGLISIPAIVLTDVDTKAISQMTLVLNGFRTANYLTEYWAIKQLEKLSVKQTEIQTISGLSNAKVTDRSALSSLNRDLFVALRNGKIFQTHAIAISKLPMDAQSQLLETFRGKGRLLAADVNRYKPAKQAKGEAPPISDSLPKIAWSARISPQSSRPLVSYTEHYVASGHQPSAPVPVETYLHASPTHETLKEEKRGSELSDRPSVNAQFSPISERLQTPPGNHFRPEPRDNGTHIPTEETPELLVPTTASRTVSHMRNAVIAAQVLDFTKEDFLEMASRVWDDAVNQHAEQPPSADNASTELGFER